MCCSRHADEALACRKLAGETSAHPVAMPRVLYARGCQAKHSRSSMRRGMFNLCA